MTVLVDKSINKTFVLLEFNALKHLGLFHTIWNNIYQHIFVMENLGYFYSIALLNFGLYDIRQIQLRSYIYN